MTNCMSISLTAPIRVVLVDELKLFRDGIRSLMGSGSTICLAGEAGCRAEALTAVRTERPDVILLDLALGGESSLELLTELMAVAEQAKMLILTANHDSELHRKAIRLGAKGLVSKDQSFEVLAKAVERVHAGEVWLDRTMTAVVLEELSRRNEVEKLDPAAARIANLTERERDVVYAVGEGLKNKQIGNLLSISEVTVRHHLTSIYNKLAVSDRLELVIFAYRHTLVPIPRR
jgi:two-component system nitrate/nitrite response regulator NarL